MLRRARQKLRQSMAGEMPRGARQSVLSCCGRQVRQEDWRQDQSQAEVFYRHRETRVR